MNNNQAHIFSGHEYWCRIHCTLPHYTSQFVPWIQWNYSKERETGRCHGLSQRFLVALPRNMYAGTTSIFCNVVLYSSLPLHCLCTTVFLSLFSPCWLLYFRPQRLPRWQIFGFTHPRSMRESFILIVSMVFAHIFRFAMNDQADKFPGLGCLKIRFVLKNKNSTRTIQMQFRWLGIGQAYLASSSSMLVIRLSSNTAQLVVIFLRINRVGPCTHNFACKRS